MIKWEFHQFSGYKRPFVWHVTGVTPGGRPQYKFLHGVATRRSHTGKFGDFEFVVQRPGLYKVGNTKDQNGYRLVFLHMYIWRYRTIRDEADAIMIARKLQAGEAMEDVTEEMIERFKWKLSYAAHQEEFRRG